MKFNKHALILLLLSLITVSGVFAPTFNPSGGGGTSLTVRENDLSPSVSGVNVLQFTNGTVTDSGGGVASVSISGTGAPTDATYITQTANGTLTNEQALSSLATGCLGSATTTGVLSARTITGTANKVTVTNGDCSGNPTLTIPDAVTLVNPTVSTSLLLPNGTTVPGTCSIGMIYFDNDATAGVNLYGCTASNTWTLLGDGGGAGSVATDTIWDAAGDLAYGTGSNTASRLAPGTTGQVLTLGSGPVAPAWSSALTALTSISFGADPGDGSPLNLSNNTCINWEIATPGTDKCLKVNASDQLDFNGTINLSGSNTGSMQVNGATSGSLKVTTADATAQAITITGAAQTTGATTLTIPDMAGTNDTFMFAAKAVTKTNLTLDTEGTGNTVTIKRYKWIPAAGCNNVTAGPVWNLPTSNPAVAACRTGTNTTKGVLEFADGANALTAQYIDYLNEDWTGAIDATVIWQSGSTSTNNVVWQLAIACAGPGDSDDPAFTDDAFTADANLATANQYNATAANTITTTGTCAAGDIMSVRLKRDPAHASDTLAATAQFVGLSLKLREAQ